MTRRAEAVARLDLSRQRLQRAMTGEAPVSASGALLLHVVRHHPWASAAAAAALGALLARLRPWRWFSKPELWNALLPGLLARVASAPFGSWSGLLADFLQDLAAGQEPAGPAPASAASTPGEPPA